MNFLTLLLLVIAFVLSALTVLPASTQSAWW